ncbi:unnamed protein product [Alternaria alternata]
MALDCLKARFEKFKIHNSDDARGGVSTKTPYDERLLQSDEIRLLTIERNAGLLRLRISPHKFKDELEYDAISYVWGTAEASINVSCNGMDLAVTPTVFEMLQNLNPSRPCWVDSMCINQQDTEEKAIQIPLMHRIYSRAALVVIWMGMPTMQSEKFMAEFPNLLENERRWNAMATQGCQPWVDAQDLIITDKDILHGMLHILESEWFQRLWTFQECVLAKQPIILHGRLWIKFHEFLIFTADGSFNREPYLMYTLSRAGIWLGSPRALKACEALRIYQVVEEADQAQPVSTLDQLSSFYLSRRFISFEDDTYLKTCGHMLDTISEVVECPETQSLTDYVMRPDRSTHFISNPVHAANVDTYNRSLILARRTVRCTNDCGDSIPPEYLMTLLRDTRLSKNATAGYEDAWTVFTDAEYKSFQALSGRRRSQASTFYQVLKSLSGHSFFSTTSGRFGIATPGCKPGDKVCVFYSDDSLHILRWQGPENGTGAIHGEGPAEFCGVAFIPHLMKPHEQEAARLGPDEIFVVW